MSDIYAVDLALDLPAGVPDAVLEHLRWHLGIVSDLPETDSGLEGPQMLEERGPAWRTGGVLVGELIPQARGWSLTARQEIHEEMLSDLEELLELLAAHTAADGVIGYLRFYEDDVPDLLLSKSGTYVRTQLSLAGQVPS